MNHNQENIRKPSKNVFASTPTIQCKKPRESLGYIKPNTVSGMVMLFTQQKEVIKFDSDSPSEFDQKSTKDDKSIVNQISYFNDLSSIYEGSKYDNNSKLDDVDSGFDSIGLRERSRSCNAVSIGKRSNLLKAYAKYPNFKLQYLKYFGVNPKEYLRRYDIDDAAGISTGHETIGGNDVDSVAGDSLRKRSQSFSAQILPKPTNVFPKYGGYPKLKVSNLKYFVVDSSHVDYADVIGNERKEIIVSNVSGGERSISAKLAGSLKFSKDTSAGLQEKLNVESTTWIQKLNSEGDSSDAEISNRNHQLKTSLTTEFARLKARIQKSINSYKNN